ncbi:cytochrome P450 [Hyalangium minutum]|uniref:Putative cytochrome P450 hydroxylase n=1 Tax=Hyalangium minutum TaxID=394096 RepID=A0A085W3Y1_9BACT|nr:cytochrome P450 [Hyalangium minutum]KFE62394.1 putative cytochrome P450 hydroxylase [Hyalangium minutum]
MLDLMTPEARANPYPLYAELRQTGIRQVEPGGMWAVSRYDDVVAVMKEPRRFSSAGLGQGFLPPWLSRNPVTESLVMKDPPVHTQLRARVSRAFGPAALAVLEPRIRALSHELAEQLLRQEGPVDFMAHFAQRLPVSVLGLLFGLEPSQYPRLKEWADDLVNLPAGRHSLEEQLRVRENLVSLERCFEELLHARRQSPGADLISELLRPDAGGSALSHDELMSFLFALLPAGIETTVYLLANSMVVLSEHPQERARVLANPSLLPQLLEEVLRFEPPGHSSLRLVTEDTVLSGVHLPRGSIVLVLLASALRDERHFPQAGQFLMERERASHLAFGHGIHYCLGALLARLEARLGLEALFSRLQDFSRASPELHWSPSLIARGPLVLPLQLIPRR